ncbi:hypothetical protein BFW91_01155 [Pseudomonas fluorescens]|uniref:hypothetical protein n=1 Tax=Pseudomonas fluorescens TaxID=294 RepID=UPI00099B4A78|nr:hypothetical protein [Pseudomonas fluorescens]OPB16722.1 hypothetical protein BFW91_01155 [Pseudomonas fluorescens]
MNDKMREEFEASVLSEYPNQNMGKFATGEYQSTTIEHCWWAWQQSRKTLVVELPQQSGANRDWNQAIRYCHQAIEAAGVRVKS